MNTTLSTETGRHDHPPHLEPERARHTRRVNLLDRAALHLGLALITWSRRRPAPMSCERHAQLLEQEAARLERERAADRMLRLTGPWR